ncbi:GyrI-like domain-containing protein [Clostridium sp. CCUG 7971]|uniref:GyrI-like domain-containing protein n=1 Tax=Clostridium sp. CCUG 7971 TaxID=2811414 RepID=UPI001ABB6FDE|nr:GyrI-like domain-containing protein [Clostridium sp. CCUG 7971]MBO3445543.1 GyrI-like domain-containing protein [Clostridium sp. CCUG 7971]
MKHEWRKKEKLYYIPKTKAELVNIESMKFIQIKGEGNPNEEAFSEVVGALYSVAYTIKMMPRNNVEIPRYFEYVVYPLEGLWDLKEEARNKDSFDKSELIYTIMIRQPEFVTEDIFKDAIKIVKRKKPNKLLDKVEFSTIEDGLCVQMMHIGHFDEEEKTFKVMKKYCEENNLALRSKVHREIYISDFRKTEQSKLKTVLRYMVEKG